MQYDSPEGRICLNCYPWKQPRQTTPESPVEGDKKKDKMKSGIWGLIAFVVVIGVSILSGDQDPVTAIFALGWFGFWGLVLLWAFWPKKRKKGYEILKEAEEKDKLGRGEKRKNEQKR